MHKGQCLCGQIQYEFEGEPLMSGVCHCKNCQRQVGSAFSTISGLPKAAFKLTGSPKLYQDDETDSGNPVERYFCGNCGSPIYSLVASQPDLLFLKTGTLDDTGAFVPQFQVYCETKQNWVALLEDTPQSARGS